MLRCSAISDSVIESAPAELSPAVVGVQPAIATNAAAVVQTPILFIEFSKMLKRAKRECHHNNGCRPPEGAVGYLGVEEIPRIRT